MSIANNRLKASRKPHLTRLPQGRLRVERWFEILHEADVYDASLTLKVFGGFGLLDGSSPASFPKIERNGSAYANCRLVEEKTEEIFSKTGKRFHQLYQVYETLTAEWVLEDVEKPSSTDSGLGQLVRSEVAKVGVSPQITKADVGVLMLEKGVTLVNFPVSGFNLFYKESGSADGKAQYLISGSSRSVGWSNSLSAWYVTNELGAPYYICDEDVDTPDLCVQWKRNDVAQAAVEGYVRRRAADYYLSGFDDDSNDRRGRMVSRWAEAGQLKYTRRYEGEGVFEATYVFQGVEGAVVGPVTYRDTDNFDGFKLFVVRTRQDKDGNALNNVSGNLVHSFDNEVVFEYPGEVNIGTNSSTFNTVTEPGGTPVASVKFDEHFYNLEKAPVKKPIPATFYVFYQDSGTIAAGDYTYGSASGRWAPDTWAKGMVEAMGCGYNVGFSEVTSVQSLSNTQTLNRYTAVAPLSKSVQGFVSGTPSTFNMIEGSYIHPTHTGEISVSGGPGVPEGNTYVLSVDIREAFTDLSGNIIWKKVIVVAQIPARS